MNPWHRSTAHERLVISLRLEVEDARARAEARVAELEEALREVKCWIADYTECDCDEEGTCLIHRVEDIGSAALAKEDT